MKRFETLLEAEEQSSFDEVRGLLWQHVRDGVLRLEEAREELRFWANSAVPI